MLRHRTSQEHPVLPDFALPEALLLAWRLAADDWRVGGLTFSPSMSDPAVTLGNSAAALGT
jgi:hypothetical protein